jgi:hypothetical protein
MQDDVITGREINCVKFAMDVSGTKKTPASRAAHITDGSDAATTQAAVNAVLVVLENLGFVATS